MIELSPKCKQEQIWWIQNLGLSNEVAYTIATKNNRSDVSMTGWGQFVRDRQQGGAWSVQE